MAGKPLVFVGVQRQRQGDASEQPIDAPTLSLVAAGMIGERSGDDLTDFLFIAGSFVADRHGLRAARGVTGRTSYGWVEVISTQNPVRPTVAVRDLLSESYTVGCSTVRHGGLYPTQMGITRKVHNSGLTRV